MCWQRRKIHSARQCIAANINEIDIFGEERRVECPLEANAWNRYEYFAHVWWNMVESERPVEQGMGPVDVTDSTVSVA